MTWSDYDPSPLIIYSLLMSVPMCFIVVILERMFEPGPDNDRTWGCLQARYSFLPLLYLFMEHVWWQLQLLTLHPLQSSPVSVLSSSTMAVSVEKLLNFFSVFSRRANIFLSYFQIDVFKISKSWQRIVSWDMQNSSRKGLVNSKPSSLEALSWRSSFNGSPWWRNSFRDDT